MKSIKNFFDEHLVATLVGSAVVLLIVIASLSSRQNSVSLNGDQTAFDTAASQPENPAFLSLRNLTVTANGAQDVVDGAIENITYANTLLGPQSLLMSDVVVTIRDKDNKSLSSNEIYLSNRLESGQTGTFTAHIDGNPTAVLGNTTVQFKASIAGNLNNIVTVFPCVDQRHNATHDACADTQ